MLQLEEGGVKVMKRLFNSICTALLITFLSVSTTAVFAKKGGNGGGKPDPDPPTWNATGDIFPSFAYLPMPPVEIWLSSSNGCRRELAAETPDLRGQPTIHMASVGGGNYRDYSLDGRAK